MATFDITQITKQVKNYVRNTVVCETVHFTPQANRIYGLPVNKKVKAYEQCFHILTALTAL